MPNDPNPSEMRDHYDFGPAANPVQGRYFEKYRQGTNIVLFDPELTKHFPSSDAVNEALRQLISQKASHGISE
jgi:hypothetical protein